MLFIFLPPRFLDRFFPGAGFLFFAARCCCFFFLLACCFFCFCPIFFLSLLLVEKNRETEINVQYTDIFISIGAPISYQSSHVIISDASPVKWFAPRHRHTSVLGRRLLSTRPVSLFALKFNSVILSGSDVRSISPVK